MKNGAKQRTATDVKMKLNYLSGLVARRAGLLLGVAGLTGLAALTVMAKDAPKLTVLDREVDRSARGASYANVLKRVTPSVVTIESTRTIKVRQFRHPFMDDPVFRRYFGPQFDSGEEGARKRRLESLGSGVIVTEDGYIITNNHVVEGADEDGVKIAMPDGKTRYDAKVVGKDPRTDVAILKIEASKKFPALPLADSDKLEVGDVVLAVGNPFGIGQSVSSGIISALSRGFGILGQQGYEDFIQTDASINQGNSGGALVDVEGRLIGINQSIASPSGGNAGVGFAIPINLVRSVMERLVMDGKIVRGYLGVSLQPLSLELAEAFKLTDAAGALVNGVQPGTPAAKAGMQAGDVIVEVNGKKVNDSAHLRLIVAQTPPKTAVTFRVLRDGKARTVNVTLAEFPEDLASVSREAAPEKFAEATSSSLDGVEIADLDREGRRRYVIAERVSGVLVTKVEEDSPAAEAGLRPGDVIVEVDRQPVQSAKETVDLVRNAKGKRVLLLIYNQAGGVGGTRYVPVPTGKK
jgi:serine protease Do